MDSLALGVWCIFADSTHLTRLPILPVEESGIRASRDPDRP
jgi:hypothetical protein